MSIGPKGILNRSPFSGRHEARRALSTDGRFGRLRRTGNRPSVGNAVPHQREALLFGFDPDAPAPLEFGRRDVAQRGVAPLGIVVTDVLDDRLPRLFPRLEVHVVDAL